MNLRQGDIQLVISDFRTKCNPVDRYTSFDYCYNFFKTTSSSEIQKNLERSCLTLGFYLASWGMLRGSSFLLGKSARYYAGVIEYIASLPKDIWLIDVDNYSSNADQILDIYENVKSHVIENSNADLTLTTKILLGVFGFIPAYDQYFANSFREIFQGSCGFRKVNRKSLKCIELFYNENKDTIDNEANNIETIDFLTGVKSGIKYPKAKIIDMYGFNKGLKDSRKNDNKIFGN
ncbi:MAG: hypothetical protein QY309_13250 [Cyclobacteriaceae bacterium]|nr:MAG: hypothetical protein QY309_13250 [Cyclobacteriaceae bacterium]